MNTILFISLILIAATAIAFRFSKRRTAAPVTLRSLPDSQFDGLFAEQHAEDARALAEEDAGRQAKALRRRLLDRAAEGGIEALDEAQALNDDQFYKQVLRAIYTQADGNPKVLQSIAEHIARGRKLRSSGEFAEAMIGLWSKSPDHYSLANVLHLAALADDAGVFNRAINAVLAAWSAGQIEQVSARELLAAVESAYWTVAGEIRTSGSGFLLKQAIADLRRELAAANRRSA